jgi:hypothetical protein
MRVEETKGEKKNKENTTAGKPKPKQNGNQQRKLG